MDHQAINAVFRPKSSKMEARADQTTKAVRQMQATEVASRDAKTARLKAARLVKEAEDREMALKEGKPTRASKARKRV